ncbi:MAG: DUF3396 domain-containing protein [Methylococcaceae bacterium]|nr:DUF3396 domain-containing protein [Methylococcaceae bacterium]
MEIPLQGFTPKDLDKIKIKDGKGNIIAVVGMMVTLYLENPYEKKMRLAVGHCIDEYMKLVKSYLRRYGNEKLGVRKFSQTPIQSVAEMIKPLDEHDFFELVITGSETNEEVSPYNLKSILNNKRSYKQIGYLSATFPLEFLEQQPAGFFQHFVHGWCKRLSPYHGYGGLGLIRSVDTATARRAEPLLHPMLQRFPGLEIDMPHFHKIYCVDGIKGINWLTMLSEHFLQKLGGKAALRAQLDDDFIFYDYPGGVMIQAGPFPQIGDMEQGNIPKQYQTLYRLVKSVQTDKLKNIVVEVPEGVNAKEFTQQWLHRFE